MEFFVIKLLSQFPRSSSGFCEKFAGHCGSDPGPAEDSRSAHIVNSASCFLDLNSSGDLVTRALADLDLSASVELLSGGGYDDDNQHSMISCDTAELLRTPSPCVVESDHEEEPGNADVEARNASTEREEHNQGKQDQWGALSLIQIEKGQGFCMPKSGGTQSMTDIPSTSTPKRKGIGHTVSSDTTQIVEGRYEGCAYHRDGTRVGWYYHSCSSISLRNLHLTKLKGFNRCLVFSPDVQCDVCRTDLPDGSSMFCVWMRRPGQQGTLMQTDRSRHNQSGASLGEVSEKL